MFNEAPLRVLGLGSYHFEQSQAFSSISTSTISDPFYDLQASRSWTNAAVRFDHLVQLIAGFYEALRSL